MTTDKAMNPMSHKPHRHFYSYRNSSSRNFFKMFSPKTAKPESSHDFHLYLSLMYTIIRSRDWLCALSSDSKLHFLNTVCSPAPLTEKRPRVPALLWAYQRRKLWRYNPAERQPAVADSGWTSHTEHHQTFGEPAWRLMTGVYCSVK